MIEEFIVCPECRGHGQVTNPEIDGNGITGSEMEELGPDFLEDYLSGAYNIPCPCCHGQNVVTPSRHKEFIEDQAERRSSERESLMEMGIYPGHRDWR